MSEVVKTKRVGGILEVTLDRPKANAIDLVTSRLMGGLLRNSVTTQICAWRLYAPPVTRFSLPAGTSRQPRTATRSIVIMASVDLPVCKNYVGSTSR